MKKENNIKLKSILNTFLIVFVLFSSCDKEVSKSPVEPEPSKGIIKIESIPAGATIFLNGKNTGRITPDSLTFIEPDTYQLTLRKKYFKDTSLVVNIGQDERKNIFVDYLENPSMYGTITLRTDPPGANINMNDSLLANVITPATLNNLLPGEYNFKFQLANHRERTLTAVSESGKNNDYFVTLRDTSIWVDFRTQTSEIQSDFLTCIDLDNNGNKWIGSNDAGVILFNENVFASFNTNNSSLPANKITAIKLSPSNEVWVGTDVGVARYNNAAWIVYNNSNSGIENNNITSINFDSEGNTWVGTTNGIAKFNGSSWQHIDYNSSLVEFLWVSDFDIDNNNTLWIGTSNFGIVSYSGSVFIEYHSGYYGFPTDKISTVALDLNSNIWFGHNSDLNDRGGLSYYDGNNFTSLFIGSILIKSNNITTDLNNNKWISTNEGLFKINNQNILEEMFDQTNSLLSSNSVLGSIVDENVTIWVATFGGGLNKYKPPR